MHRLRSSLPLFALSLVVTLFAACGGPAPAKPPAEQPVNAASPATSPAPAQPAPAPPAALTLVGTYPLAGESITTRAVLYFSDDLVLRGDAPAVTFEPEIPGAEATVNGNVVVVNFTQGTPEPDSYRPILAEGLVSVNGAKPKALPSDLVFTSGPSNVPVAKSLTRLDSGGDDTRLELRFTLAMGIDAVQQALSAVDANGTTVAVSLEATDDPRAFAFTLPSDVMLPVQVTIPAGTLDASGQVGTAEERVLDYPSSTLEVSSVTLAPASEADAHALRTVWNFSSEVDAQAATSQISAVDANGNPVAVTVAAGDTRESLLVEVPASTDSKLTITLKQGFASANGKQAMSDDYVLAYPASEIGVESITWNAGESSDSLSFVFSESLRFSDLLKQLKVIESESGEAISVEPTDMEGADGTLTIYGASGADTLNVMIDGGLRGLSLGLLAMPYTTELTRDPMSLDLGWSEWEQRGKDGLSYRINFNQPLDITSLREAVSFAPGVANLTVEHNYGNTYRIGGDFAPATEYILKIATSLRDASGGSPLEDEFTLPLDISPEATPGAGFPSEDKFYFPRRNAGILPLEARDVDEVTVNVSQMFPNNIAMAVNEIGEGKTWSDFSGSWAKPLAEKKIPVAGAQGKAVQVKLDLNEVIPAGALGVFGLNLSPEPYGYSTKIVVWTNIGLMAHWMDDALVVFAHDLFTVAPLPNAKVTVWSAKNQVMAEGATDADGVAQFKALDKTLGLPTVVVCETGSDYTFLQLTPRTDDAVPSTEDMPGFDRKAYDAFLYADRNLYRPGETVHARWIVRTNYGDALANTPLQYVLTNPQGAEVQKEAVTLSDLGTGGIEIPTDKAWPTGKYTVTLSPPDAAPSGTVQFSLEDFVPNRIKTEVSFDGGPWSPKTEYGIQVKAEQLFGGPARAQAAKASVILRKGEYKPEAWAGFRFTNDADFKPEVAPLGEAQTDDTGLAGFTYSFPGSKKITFPIQATVRGEVAEAGARPVADTKDVLLFPSDVLLGVAVSAGANQGAKVDVAAINTDDSPAAIKQVKVILEREDWSYYVRSYASYNEPEFTKSYLPVAEETVTLTAGRGSVEFALSEYSWGYHRVRVVSDETPMVASTAFYKMWNGIEASDTPRPSLIKVTADKPEYNVGEEVTLRIESPFDGRAVVVVQGGEFQRVLGVDIANAVGVVRFTTDQAMNPNVWAGVTVVHKAPADRAQVYPYSSFAMANIPVRDPGRRIEVALSGVPEEIRPNTELSVTLETKGADGAGRAAEVTLAAVDEGIHQILDYTNPDPWNYLQRFRSPDYRRAHYYDRVAYDFDAEAIGGDLANRLAKRGATIGENWIKPVALWTGAVRTDATGKATLTLPVPEFTGQLRLVAVAADATATGAGAAQVYVRRPYMLQTSLPRFVLPGDSFQARATVFNTTGADAAAKVAWAPGGALLAGPGEGALSVAAGRDAGLLASITAGNSIGQGSIGWTLSVDGAPENSVTLETPLPVRPPAAFQTRHALVLLAPGETRTFKNAEFAEDAGLESSVTVGADPALRVFNALKYLIGYPYGCVEQTTSQCFPLYVLRKSSALMNNTLAQNERIEAYLERGIQRLLSMQVSSGGLGYWPGAREADRYASVYALHFLTLVARDGELTVPEAPLNQLKDYVRRLSTDSADRSASGLYLRAYAHFVLALGGDQQALEQIERFDTLVLPESARYLLAAALAVQTGDAARVADYLATKPMTPFNTLERGGTLNSETRGDAVKLMALAQMGAPQDQMAPFVERIATALDRPVYANTQEVAFCAAALGMYFEKVAVDSKGTKGTVTGPEGVREFGAGDLFTLKHGGPGGEFTVANTGTASVYVSHAMSGMPLQPVKGAISEGGLSLARSITLKDGSPLPEGGYKQGETYLVQLQLQGGNGLENLVISDLLPAGLEVENPRLDANALAGANVSGMATPSYLDIRDDRLIIAFDRVPSADTRYYYAVRAVTPGTYQHPAAFAECMYDPSFRASTEGGTAQVVE